MALGTFGERLKAARLAAKMDVGPLALKVGVTEGAIRQMESGQTKSASLKIGLRLAKALGVTPEHLAGEPESLTPPAGQTIEKLLSTLRSDLEEEIAAVDRRAADALDALEQRLRAGRPGRAKRPRPS